MDRLGRRIARLIALRKADDEAGAAGGRRARSSTSIAAVMAFDDRLAMARPRPEWRPKSSPSGRRLMEAAEDLLARAVGNARAFILDR